MWPLTCSATKNTANIPRVPTRLRTETRRRSDSGSAPFFRTVLLLLALVARVADAKRQSIIVDNQKINFEVVSRICLNFTIGYEQEFLSPNYPNNYPNLTECFKTITAPYGYVIRLEFREHFDVEPSQGCEHDFLEVRDGAHGYAKLIGQFCGHSFPPEVTSSDRYLWMRFVSDDTIEYRGFRVAYRYIRSNAIDRPELAPCHFMLRGYEGIFGTSDIQIERKNYSRTYQVPINCLWEIEVLENWKIYLNIYDYKLAEINECEVNFIDIFTETLELRYRLAHFCGSLAESQWTKTNKLHVLLFMDHRALDTSFSAYFTAFRNNKGEGCIKDEEFDCEDNTCISPALRCNNRQNCKYKRDEEDCVVFTASFLSSQRVVIILVVGLLLLLSILIPASWNCYRKIKEENNGRDDEDDDANRIRPSGLASASSAQGSLGGGPHTAESSLHGGHGGGRGGGGGNNSGFGGPDDDDDDTGCYVPEVDLSVFLQRSNGGGNNHSLSQDGTLLSGQETPLDSTLPFDSADPLIATAPPPPLLPLVSHLLRSAALAAGNKEPRHNSAYEDLPPPLKSSSPPPSRALYRQAAPPVCNHLLDMPATPPPPSIGNNNNDAENNNSFPNQPFFPPPPTLEEVEESDAIFGMPPHTAYGGRTGGLMNNNPRRFKAEAVIEMSQRPRSFESTKSAPDVIARL